MPQRADQPTPYLQGHIAAARHTQANDPRTGTPQAFDTASDQQGLDMRIDSTPQALASFKKIAADDIFNVNIGR